MEDNLLEDALKAGGLDIDTNLDAEYGSEMGKKSVEVKKELEKMTVTNNSLLFAFEDIDGEPISPREESGTYFVDMIDMNKIAYSGTKENQIRQTDLEMFSLQQNIEKIDLVNPIHVIPFGRQINPDDGGLPKYPKYLILDGRRRYEACRALGKQAILAIVDTTINKQLIEMYKGIVQNSKDYTFSEKVAYADRMKKEQRSMSVETLENFLGYHSGEFIKSLYIDQFKVDYPDIYTQVEKGKMSIEQGFKRLEKEIEKAEKALEQADDMTADDVEDALRDKQGLGDLQIDNHTQALGERHILDANIRRSVESRDMGTCQCCGFGSGEDDFMGGFNAHHIVPVMYQGPDVKANLILLCKNCHGFVHDYEVGRFNPDQHTYDKHLWVQKVVVLGNMLRSLRTKSLKEIAKKDPNTYNLLQKGSLSLGKSIAKSGIVVGGMEMFDNDPYQTFMDATEDLEYGGEAKGAFGILENFKDELEEEQDLPEENHRPRNLTKEEVVALTSEEVRERDEQSGLVETKPEQDLDIESERIDATQVIGEDEDVEEHTDNLFDLLEKDDDDDDIEVTTIDDEDAQYLR